MAVAANRGGENTTDLLPCCRFLPIGPFCGRLLWSIKIPQTKRLSSLTPVFPAVGIFIAINSLVSLRPSLILLLELIDYVRYSPCL